MDKVRWIIGGHAQQFRSIGNLLEGGSDACLKLDVYKSWLKLFDFCKFMLHNFDQSLTCAWPEPRSPIDKAMLRIKHEVEHLMITYYRMKQTKTNPLKKNLLRTLDKE